MEPKFIERDISWLSFSERVLMEASDKSLSFRDRLRFLAIFSSNLDEFYKTRVSSYRSILEDRENAEDTIIARSRMILSEIHDLVNEQQQKFGVIFRDEILPEMRANGIFLLGPEEYPRDSINYIKDFFFFELMPFLQPIMIIKKQLLPFLQDNVIYHAIKLYKRNSKSQDRGRKARYAMLRIPCDSLPRFVVLPSSADRLNVAFLDDIIRLYAHILFPGYDISGIYSIKLSRDADLHINDEFEGSLVDKIEASLKRRKTGVPCRFLYDESIPPKFLKLLRQAFNISSKDLVAGGRYHNYSDFFDFPFPDNYKSQAESLRPLKHKQIKNSEKIFEVLRKKDLLLHFPYQSFDYILDLFRYASRSPEISSIALSVYRLANHSAILDSLITAAENGKEVSVFVELKARFDEMNNLNSARKLRRAGARIFFSLPGIKVHAKMALFQAEAHSGMPSMGLVSTGNFNEKTAAAYADTSLLTTDGNIIREMRALFDYLTDQARMPHFEHLLVGRFTLKDKILEFIKRESRHALEGFDAHIIIKINNLQNPEVMNALWSAALAGVKVDLIVRGICCLLPDYSNLPNLRIIRIVDNYLEHARYYYFSNKGREDIFLSSADMMNRNLHSRIELAVPLYDSDLKAEIKSILDIQLADNVKACYINEKAQNIPVEKDTSFKIRAQNAIRTYLSTGL